MSAKSTNPNLSLASQTVLYPSLPVYYAPGREALQALLAFSSLHQQIRQRRARQLGAGGGGGEIWRTEYFVLDEVLELVSLRALAITGAEGVAIALTEGDEILCRASVGNIAPPVGARLNPDSGFSGACFRTGLIVRCDDAAKDPRVDAEACRRMGLRSMVGVPLLTEYGVVGLLAAFCTETYGFNDTDVRSLTLLAELILAALQPEEDFRTASDAPREADALPLAHQAVEPRRAEATESEYSAVAVQQETRPSAEPEDDDLIAAEITSRENEFRKVQALREVLARAAQEQQSAPVTRPVQNERPEIPSQALLSGYSLFQDPAAQNQATPNLSRGRTGLVITLLLLLALILAGGATWWRRSHHPVSSVGASSDPQAQTPAPTSVSDSPAPNVSDGATVAPDNTSALPQVTGIRHWSSSDSSTVAIDLQDQVQYEAHRLTDPERIYFDLHDTNLASAMPRTIEVGDALLVRLRIAQPSPGVTRVVLETKSSPNFSVSMEENPYRLVVELRSITAPPKSSKKVNLFAPTDRSTTARALFGKTPAAQKPAPGQWLMPPATSTLAGNAPGRAHLPAISIVLDAGHGGWDMGTVGRKGLLEKDLVLDIVARLGRLVNTRLGADVIYTRHDDTYISLEKRTEIANLSQADLFLSVHANYSDYPSARGVETYYTNTYSSDHARTHGSEEIQPTGLSWTNVDVKGKVQESRHLAADVQQSLYRALAAKNPELRNRGVKQASYVVLTGTTMPAILAEVSFVSSPSDETSLQSATYRQEIAEALYRGVATYAANLHRVNLASTSGRPEGQ